MYQNPCVSSVILNSTIMKVDKAVCTNDTFDDLSRAIRYETVFTTLVENKILAIKRECEEHQRLKDGKRSFGNIISGKHIFCIKRNSVTETDLVVPDGGGGGGVNDGNGGECDGCCSVAAVTMASVVENDDEELNLCQQSTDKGSTAGSGVDERSDEGGGGGGVGSPLKEYNGGDEKKVENIIQQQTLVQHKGKSINKILVECKKHEPDLVQQKSHSSQSSGIACSSPSDVKPHKRILSGGTKHQSQYDADCIHASDAKSDNDSVHSDKSRKITFQADEIREKRQKMHRSRCRPSDDSNSSAASSYIEIYVSDESIKKLQPDTLPAAINYPTSTARKAFSTQEHPTGVEHERSRLRVLEAKSISAQCSPVFPRPIRTGSQISCPDDIHYRTAYVSTYAKVLSRRNTSDDSTASVTFGASESIADGGRGGDCDKLSKLTHTAAAAALGKCKKIDISSKLENNDKVVSRVTHGFINSFNQLTSNKNLPAVITTTKLRGTNFDTIKLQRLSDGRTATAKGASDMGETDVRSDKKEPAEKKDDELVDGKKRNKDTRYEID